MKSVYSQIGPRSIHQSEKLTDHQVANHAGGFVFAVDCWQRLDRFLILGSEGGTYYVDERKLTKENVSSIQQCLQEDGQRTVRRIVEVSQDGKAPKNDPAILALALCMADESQLVREAAAVAIPDVCRIGTHLFHFCEFVQQFRGWGRLLRDAIANWYTRKTEDELAFQLLKYQQRDGWSHKDVLRKCHIKGHNSPLLRWAIGADRGIRAVIRGDVEKTYAAVGRLPNLIQAYEEIKKIKTAREAADLIALHGLTREMVPTPFLAHACVWEALYEEMPITALIRNLGKLTQIGVLGPLNTRDIVSQLTDRERIRKGRVHPIQFLIANLTYAQGHGTRGSLTWDVVPQIMDALEEGFYRAFEFVEPTQRRTLLGIDVSGSMSSTWGNEAAPGLTCAIAAAAMAMVTIRTEPNYYAHGFADSFVDLSLSPKMGITEVTARTRMSNFGRTDCALPMVYALDQKISVDTFIIYTDNETWCGDIHPAIALRDYRYKMGINAKLIVVGMVATGFSIADPRDAGMLDVVGFSTDIPLVIAEFSKS